MQACIEVKPKFKLFKGKHRAFNTLLLFLNIKKIVNIKGAFMVTLTTILTMIRKKDKYLLKDIKMNNYKLNLFLNLKQMEFKIIISYMNKKFNLFGHRLFKFRVKN